MPTLQASTNKFYAQKLATRREISSPEKKKQPRITIGTHTQSQKKRLPHQIY